MTDPKEKNEQEENKERATSNKEQADKTNGTNWHEHQRVDEEGNELDPEDVK